MPFIEGEFKEVSACSATARTLHLPLDASIPQASVKIYKFQVAGPHEPRACGCGNS